MSYYYAIPLVNEAELAQVRASLGHDLARVLGYFREDGAKSIEAIESALAEHNAAAMILPAHTLKGESRQFGAERLAEVAEVIETTARRCIEQHAQPDEVAVEIAMLRACFVETLAILEPETVSPLLAQPGQAARASTPTRMPFAPGPRTFGRRTH